MSGVFPSEDGEDAVARLLYDATMVVCDGRFDDPIQQKVQNTKGTLLVEVHEAGVANHIGQENCRQPSLDSSLAQLGHPDFLRSMPFRGE